MKRSLIFRIIVTLALLLAAAGTVITAAAADGSPQTYTVLVGAENVKRGLDVMAYFPQVLKIHAGDTVVWKQNTHEIHTVTFLAGAELPLLAVPVPDLTPPLPGPLMLNPQVAFPTTPADGLYDGSTYANSGVMSTDPGQPTEWSLTFTQEGTFNYVCVVHGMMMSGTIMVVDPSVKIPTPTAILKQAQRMTIQKLARANGLLGKAMSSVPKAKRNLDGTKTYTVLVGWNKGQFDLMRFFPKNLVVHPGDTVIFQLSTANVAPHTVTFFNGGADIPFVVPVPNPPGPPFLLVNPEVLAPIQPGVPLALTGVFSSGLLNPEGPGPKSWTLKIGDISGKIPYECILHDSSGMEGTLKVVPK